MALNSFSKTTFMAGPEDALVAADAYGAGEVTAIDSDTVKYGLDIPSSPVGIKIKPPGIPEIGLKLKDLPKAEVLDRVLSSDVSIKNCFTNMSDAAKGLLKIPGELLTKVESTINGVITKIKNLGNFDPSEIFKKLGDLKAIGCTANALSDGKFNLSITDKGGLSGLISGITNQASFMGVNNVFSSISSVINDKDVLQSALKNILPNAIKDIGLLKDLATTGIVGNIKSMMPNVSGNTIQNFRINPGTKNFELPNIFGNINSTLNTIDSSWNNVTRNGEKLIAGNLLTSSSANDFHKTLEASVMYNPLPFVYPDDDSVPELPTYDKPEMFLMLTKDLGEQDVKQCLRSDFATLPVSVNESFITDTYIASINQVIPSYNMDNTYIFNDDDDKDAAIVQSTKIDNNTQQINVKQFDEEGILIIPEKVQLPNKTPSPPAYPPEGSYVRTGEYMIAGTLFKVEITQGPMKGKNPSYDKVTTAINSRTSEILSVERTNSPSLEL